MGAARMLVNEGWTEAAGKRIVRMRAGGQCEVALKGICTIRPTDFSHRKGRGVGGTWAPSNGLHACRSCHTWIGEHKTVAYRNGWMVKGAYSHEDMPVVLRGSHLVKLIDQPPYYVPVSLV